MTRVFVREEVADVVGLVAVLDRGDDGPECTGDGGMEIVIAMVVVEGEREE